MSNPTTKFKVISIFWALLLSIGIIALAGSVLLPSTKRARVDLTERFESERAAPSAPVPTSAPSSDVQPASRAS